jgi:hypothetical protein
LAHILAADEADGARSTYYLDLTVREFGAEELYNQAVEDFVEFGGPGVTFIIDNVHLGERLAAELVGAWTEVGLSAGSRLLLLGRERNTPQGSPLGGHEPLMLRAGADELRGVVARLLAREGRSSPPICAAQTREWIATFGGDPDDPQTSVDLVAFSAAVQRQLAALGNGVMELRPEDAVEGVRTRYWRPVEAREEAANLQRLAALAVLEVVPTDDALPFPSTGFPTSGRGGLVLFQDAGNGGRKFYRLAHPALGQLLLRAIGIADQGAGERRAAARERAALALRLAYQAVDPDETAAMRNHFVDAARSGSWLESCANLHDAIVVARALPRENVATAAELDTALASSVHLRQLLAECRSPATWILFLSFLRQRAMSQTLESIVRQGRDTSLKLARMLLGTKAHQVASFLRFHPAGAEIMQAIPPEEWASMQLAHAPKITATETVSALIHFEKQGRPDLARPPALAQVIAADPPQWRDADLTHLSHILRLAHAEAHEAEPLIVALDSAGWLSSTVKVLSTGALSGALLSLFNHVPETVLAHLPVDALEQRVGAELRDHAASGGEPGTRAICLLGTASEICPSLSIPPDVSWPSAKVIASMVSLRVRKDSLQQLGTHEIQLWLGLVRVAELRNDPVELPNEQGRRVLRLLNVTRAPSARSDALRLRLVSRLERLDEVAWVACSRSMCARAR